MQNITGFTIPIPSLLTHIYNSSLSSNLNVFLAQAFLLLILTFLIWSSLIYPHFFNLLRHIPSAPIDTSISRIRRFFYEPNGPDFLRMLNQTSNNNGLLRYSGLLGSTQILITSPEAVREVMQEKARVFQRPWDFVRRAAGPLLGNGLMTVPDGQDHKTQRKHWAPMFSSNSVKKLYPLYWSKTIETIAAITDDINSRRISGDRPASIDIKGWAGRVTLDIMGVAAFGHDLNIVKEPNGNFNKIFRGAFGRKRTELLRVCTLLTPGWILRSLPFQLFEDERKAAQLMKELCRKIIRESKEQLKSPEGGTKVDMLSRALESNAFSENELVDHLMTFLAAGHETTAAALAWGILLLSKHPEKQDRLRKEVHARLPSPRRAEDVEADQFDKISYLRAICNEILRTRPSAPFLRRKSIAPATIVNHAIPAGTYISISPWAIQRSTTIWGSDAMDFNPDRWISSLGDGSKASRGGADSSYGFLPFSHGPRNCIGMNFANAELAVLIAGFVGSFEMRPEDPDADIEAAVHGIIASPVDGVMVRMRRLEW